MFNLICKKISTLLNGGKNITVMNSSTEDELAVEESTTETIESKKKLTNDEFNEILRDLQEVGEELGMAPKTKKQKAPKTPKIPKAPSGMNNTTMTSLLKENSNDTEALTTLFNENEELFIKNVQSVKDDIKNLLLPIIQIKYPNATIQQKNPKVKHVVL